MKLEHWPGSSPLDPACLNEAALVPNLLGSSDLEKPAHCLQWQTVSHGGKRNLERRPQPMQDEGAALSTVTRPGVVGAGRRCWPSVLTPPAGGGPCHPLNCHRHWQTRCLAAWQEAPRMYLFIFPVKLRTQGGT